MMKKSILTNSILAAAASLMLAACGGGEQPNVELIQDFMVSPAVKAQKYDESSPNGIGMRVPPEHTVPVGFHPYRYKGDLAGAEKMENPLGNDNNPENLIKGQKVFETHCMVCHGQVGKGDGPVAAKMALKPPPVVSDRVKAWTDGHIYHVITEGQGLMNPYAAHVPQNVRWQLVNYIRYLQKNSN